MLNLTAFSQITGISRDSKQQIVSTLEAYKILLDEFHASEILIINLNSIISDLNEKSSIQYEIIKNKELQIQNYKKQIELYNNRMDKSNSGVFLYGKVNFNGFNGYGTGIDYVYKNKIISGLSTSYYTEVNYFVLEVKIGIKIF